MKSLIFILSSLLFIGCFTVRDRYSDNNYPKPYELHIVDSIGGSKDQLFVKANEWVAKTFTSAKDVIQMHDKEAGKIIAKGVMVSQNHSDSYYIYYTLSIDVKQGKYKIHLSDFTLKDANIHNYEGHGRLVDYNRCLDNEDESIGFEGRTQWNNIRGDCWVNAQNLVKDFRKAMKQQDSNW